MKRIFLIVLTVLLLCLCGCSSYRTDITREEIIAVYEDAGYNVSSGVYDEKMDNGTIAYARADHPNGDYIYFNFFESNADAKAFKNSTDHPVMMLFFSALYGDPSWIYVKCYGCVVVSYNDPNHFYPFEGLLVGD